MVLLFTFVAFEVWVLHHHGPTDQERHGDYKPRWPGAFPEDEVKQASAALPGEALPGEALPAEPSLPDWMKGAAVVAETEPPVNPTEEPGAGAQTPKTGGDGVAGDLTLTARPMSEEDESGGSREEDEGYGDMRVAVLVPYSGPGLPLWFDAFTDLAAANKDLVDWIIFCAEVRIKVFCRTASSRLVL